jgi:hypothetical protein
MPVPGGEITTTEIWQAPVVETVEEVVDAEEAEDIALFDAAMAEDETNE